MAKFLQLSRSLLAKLQSLDPILDHDWTRTLAAVFPHLDRDSFAAIQKRVLQPKGIVFLPETRRFQVAVPATLHEILPTLSSPEAAQLGKMLLASYTRLETLQHSLDVADLLESAIDRLDGQQTDDAHSRREIQQLKTAFIYQTALWVQKQQLIAPEKNQRQLSSAMINAYICQVYLKQLLQKYQFRSVYAAEMPQLEHPFLNQTLAQEAKVRDFELIETEQYYFLIGTVVHVNQSPYSLRRFLNEETVGQSQITYLNHIGFLRSAVDQPDTQQHVLWGVSRMISLQRQLNKHILSFVTDAQKFQDKYLAPMLEKPLDANGEHVDDLIIDRFLQYEKNLALLILGKLPNVLKHAEKEADFEYLYYAIQQLLHEMINNIQDFSIRSIALYSDAPQYMYLKVMCYLHFLSKNKTAIFSPLLQQHSALQDSFTQPLHTLQQLIAQQSNELAALVLQKNIAIEQQSNPQTKTSKWRLFSRPEMPPVPLETVQGQIDQLHEDTFFAIIRMAKHHPKTVTYPEFELNFNDNPACRHYALPQGVYGLSQLPKIIRLFESRELISIVDLQNTLQQDVLKAAQQWGDLAR